MPTLPLRLIVKLKSGAQFYFAPNANAEYVIGRLHACCVPRNGIHQTIHVIPKGTIPQKGAQLGSGPKTT